VSDEKRRNFHSVHTFVDEAGWQNHNMMESSFDGTLK
jgi:hypothetical protein